jgi:hypothetical protein
MLQILRETYTNIRSLKGTPMFATATKTVGFHSLDSVGLFFAHLAAAFAGAQHANRLYRQLSGLSDSQLAARGLTREDVNRLTLQALNGELHG